MKSTELYKLLRSVIIIFSTGSILACNNSENSTVKNETSPLPAKELVFDKLTGTWKMDDGKGFERWTKKANGTYQSVAFSIKGNDTSWNEQASIYPENDQWVFENTVKGQNDGKAVKFISSLLDENRVQFSNPAHDFPTDINYTIIGTDAVRAFIVGPNNKGGKDTILFNYIRVN